MKYVIHFITTVIGCTVGNLICRAIEKRKKAI